MKIWTRSRLNELAGRASASAVAIVALFERSSVDPEEATDGGKAWGQYLDVHHHSDRQWGFYGTSAGIQAIAEKERALNPNPEIAEMRLVSLGLQQLPESVETADPRYQAKRNKGDFENVVKLAFIADGLRPNRTDVVEAETPEIVEQILDRTVENKYWSARLDGDNDRYYKERVFPTAYVVLTLGRYEKARKSVQFQNAQNWLAHIVVNDSKLNDPAHSALIGLALHNRGRSHIERSPQIQRAIEKCRTQIVNWGRDTKSVPVDRPVFFGFTLGTRTDYVFLSPEILGSIFLLQLDSPADGRLFVLRTIDALTENVLRNQGFSAQNGVMSAVDQMWAMRLISEFRSVHDADKGHLRLIPSRFQALFLMTLRARAIALSALVLIGVVLGLLVANSFWEGLVGGAVAGIFVVAASLIESIRTEK